MDRPANNPYILVLDLKRTYWSFILYENLDVQIFKDGINIKQLTH